MARRHGRFGTATDRGDDRDHGRVIDDTPGCGPPIFGLQDAVLDCHGVSET
jgi:hypothetical protein